MALKTEDLQKQGLTQDQINYVMAEYGKTVNPLKADLTSLQTQLKEAQDALKGFEGVDVAELQGKVKQLSSELEQKDADYQKQIADRDFQAILNSAISASGAKNAKAVIALLDSDALKESKNQEKDIKKALETVKKENDYLFQSEKPVPKIVSTTEGPNPAVEDKKTQANEALRSLFGKE